MSLVFSGAVLAGGRSSRFGSDKARHLYRGKPLLAWSLDSLKEARERFMISNHPYPDFELAQHPDIDPSRTSLSGLHAALSYAQYDLVAVSACDLPHLRPDYWRVLLSYADDKPVVARHDDGRLEPLAALYPRAFLTEIELALAHKQYGLQRLLKQNGFTELAAEGLKQQFGELLFLNINHPNDLPER